MAMLMIKVIKKVSKGMKIGPFIYCPSPLSVSIRNLFSLTIIQGDLLLQSMI